MISNSRIALLCGLAASFISMGILAHDPCQDPTIEAQNTPQNTQDISFLQSELEDLPALAESQLLLPIEPSADNQFGTGISLSGATLAISASNQFNDYQGYVDLFRLEAGEWQRFKTLGSPNAQSHELFRMPALDGDTLMVGAPGYWLSGPERGCGEGVVYVFERNEGGPDSWGPVQQLDGGYKSQAYFGIFVTLHNNTAVVLASWEFPSASENNGVLYIFERGLETPGEWSLAKRIESDDTWDLGYAYSGGGIFIHGDTLLVNGHNLSGMVVKTFRRNVGGPNNWGFVQQISAPGMEMHTADFDGATLLLHLQTDCVPKEERNHLLRFYGRNDQGKWTLQQEMPIPDESGHVAIDGPLALFGSEGAEVGYLLQREGTPDSWEFTARLVFTDPSIPFTKPRPVVVDAGRAVIGGPYESDEKGLALTYEVAKPINAGHAGAWFNPDTSGQGQLIDVVPESQYMFLAWFTFTAAASNNPDEQHWYTAQGNYSGNTAELILYETLGGQFDDPQETSTNPIGEVTVSFTDCEQGQMVYSIDTDGRQGTFPLERLIPGSGDVCAEQRGKADITTEAVDINAGMDGAWADEDTLGQGFLIDAHPNPDGGNFIFVAWFTYGDDMASGQRWLTAQGDFTGSTAAIDVYETIGGRFDDAQAVNVGKVGTMTIDFTDCSNALLTYSLTDDDLADDMEISRLIPGGQALCEELDGAE